jgi:hypothetical protein
MTGAPRENWPIAMTWASALMAASMAVFAGFLAIANVRCDGERASIAEYMLSYGALVMGVAGVGLFHWARDMRTQWPGRPRRSSARTIAIALSVPAHFLVLLELLTVLVYDSSMPGGMVSECEGVA